MDLGEGLSGRGVLVTGAASGVGEAAARLFADEGARVVAVDKNGDVLRRVVSGLPGEPGRHLAIPFDLGAVDDIDAMVAAAAEEVGGLAAMVHCAALLIREPVDEVSPTSWDRHVDVNLKGTFFLTRAVGDVMKAAGRGGRIVNFSSAAWLTGPWNGSDAYVATKAGVVSMSRGFARSLGPFGITVNVIAPGQVDTPMQHLDNPAELVQQTVQNTPLRRMGRPDEVARVAVFLASEHASFVSGSTIVVSGGLVLY